MHVLRIYLFRGRSHAVAHMWELDDLQESVVDPGNPTQAWQQVP